MESLLVSSEASGEASSDVGWSVCSGRERVVIDKLAIFPLPILHITIWIGLLSLSMRYRSETFPKTFDLTFVDTSIRIECPCSFMFRHVYCTISPNTFEDVTISVYHRAFAMWDSWESVSDLTSIDRTRIIVHVHVIVLFFTFPELTLTSERLSASRFVPGQR